MNAKRGILEQLVVDMYGRICILAILLGMFFACAVIGTIIVYVRFDTQLFQVALVVGMSSFAGFLGFGLMTLGRIEIEPWMPLVPEPPRPRHRKRPVQSDGLSLLQVRFRASKQA